jgi:hypothetical protein
MKNTKVVWIYPSVSYAVLAVCTLFNGGCYVAKGNQSPVVNAGADQTITLPTSSVTLTGSGRDPDGSMVGARWTQVSGPVTATIVTPSSLIGSTSVTGLTAAGTYVFQITGFDDMGATGTDSVNVIVNPAIPPTADAGADQTIDLPTSSVTLLGSGTVVSGSITGYAWIEVSGPVTAVITSPASASTGVTGLTSAGSYVFQLTVTDNLSDTGTDSMNVIVNPAALPTADAGSDQMIALPTTSVTLMGSGTAPAGSVVEYAWTQVSGPVTAVITSPASASTNVTGLTAAGTYVFQLTVTDNLGGTGTATVNITVTLV